MRLCTRLRSYEKEYSSRLILNIKLNERKKEDQRWRVRERLSFGEAGMKNALVFYRRFERAVFFHRSIRLP